MEKKMETTIMGHIGILLGLYRGYGDNGKENETALGFRGPQYRPQHTIILSIGTLKKLPLIWRNLHMHSVFLILSDRRRVYEEPVGENCPAV